MLQVGFFSAGTMANLFNQRSIDAGTHVCGLTAVPRRGLPLMTAFFQPLGHLLESIKAGGRYDPLDIAGRG